MRELKRKVICVAVLSAGMLVTLVGVAGLFLPILPGFVLILAGLYMIGKVYHLPWLDKIVRIVRQKIARHENNTHEGDN